MTQPELFSNKKENITSEKSETESIKLKPAYLKFVFSISCGTDVQTFFEMLKLHDIRVLIDTRRGRSYFRSRFSHEDDFSYICGLHGVEYQHHLDLSPTKESRELLHKHENSKKAKEEDRKEAWTLFLEEYMRGLARRKVLRKGSRLRDVVDGDQERVAIMCSCQHPLDCHRRAAISFLNRWVDGINICHLTPDDVGGKSPKLKSPRRYLIRGISGYDIETNHRGDRIRGKY